MKIGTGFDLEIGFTFLLSIPCRLVLFLQTMLKCWSCACFSCSVDSDCGTLSSLDYSSLKSNIIVFVVFKSYPDRSLHSLHLPLQLLLAMFVTYSP